ncbi:MAG: NAD(P)-binding protein [Sphingobium sp.]|jgi:phytoene dehydrogenase-like protein|uniref:phytoene desaturase family protein n=1 Tax=Sphingobium sp. TaxID=1912891 RepID=UPI003BB1C727
MHERKIVVIGAGVARLCAAAYARKCGYAVELLEQHDSAGGLAPSLRRGDYVFETCMHWLVGSRPNGILHSEWEEVCDIDSLRFVDHDEFLRIEDQHGGRLRIYADVERLEAELLAVAPEDGEEICHLTQAIRQLVDLPMPPVG